MSHLVQSNVRLSMGNTLIQHDGIKVSNTNLKISMDDLYFYGVLSSPKHPKALHTTFSHSPIHTQSHTDVNGKHYKI